MAKHKRSSDSEEIKIIEDSLKVSSYTDDIFDALQTGQDVKKGIVPNLQSKTAGSSMSTNEGNSLFAIDDNALFDISSSALGNNGVKTAAQTVPIESLSQVSNTDVSVSGSNVPKHRISLSANQQRAIKKYPALLEILGSKEGEIIVSDILLKMNAIVTKKVGSNSKKINKYAQICVADRRNLKQYFRGEGWVCCVTASGPFQGTEAIHFKPDTDQSFILRQRGDDYTNVTSEFNIIHDFGETSETQDS